METSTFLYDTRGNIAHFPRNSAALGELPVGQICVDASQRLDVPDDEIEEVDSAVLSHRTPEQIEVLPEDNWASRRKNIAGPSSAMLQRRKTYPLDAIAATTTKIICVEKLSQAIPLEAITATDASRGPRGVRAVIMENGRKRRKKEGKDKLVVEVRCLACRKCW